MIVIRTELTAKTTFAKMMSTIVFLVLAFLSEKAGAIVLFLLLLIGISMVVRSLNGSAEETLSPPAQMHSH